MTKYFTKSDDGNYQEVESFSEQQIDEITDGVPWLTKRLDRARENERAKFADYDDLKKTAGTVDELKKNHKTELEGLSTKVTELETQLGEAKLGTEKVKIMHEFKLSEDMGEFVTGKDADEMRAKAEKLAKGGGGGKPPIKKDEGKPKDGETSTDSKAIAGKLFGKKSDD